MFKKYICKLFPRFYELLSKNSIYRYKFNRLGSNSYFHITHKIVKPQHISVGDSVTIEKDAWLNIIEREGAHGYIEIQDYSNLGMRTTLSSANKIIIEKYVLLGLNVYIADHQHDYENVHDPVMFQGIKGTGSITIKEGAWLGNNVVILAPKDITIGRNSIIGANSVVKESVPDFAVAVGNPAKVIRRYNAKLKKWIKVKS